MSFCKFSSQSVINNKTEVDNIFINDFLPYAPDNAVKVYLYGLYKCSNSSSYDNTLENFSKVLKISEDEIIDIYKFWENEGLVQVINAIPLEIRYMPLKNVINNTKKYNVSKYGNFSNKAQEIIEGRMISPNEYNEYFDTIEIFHIEPEAFLMIMKYCVNTKGVNVGYPYIIAVAKNWAYEGVKTVADVEDRLISYEKNSGDLKLIYNQLGIKHISTIEEKELYLKWINELGFELNFIIQAIKLNKKPGCKLGFSRLNEILLSYYEMKISTVSEMEMFENNKDKLYKFAKKVSKELGLYYESFDKIVENYISKWFAMGFSDDAVLLVSQYCFKSSIRTFEGMNNIIKKFYKLGLVTETSLQKYFQSILIEDEEIKQILNIFGTDRQVNSFDREFYKNWKYNWKIPEELIKEGASIASDKAQPMKYLNGILANWHENGFKTLSDIKNQIVDNKLQNKKIDGKIRTREYSKEELNALFDSLEEVDI